MSGYSLRLLLDGKDAFTAGFLPPAAAALGSALPCGPAPWLPRRLSPGLSPSSVLLYDTKPADSGSGHPYMLPFCYMLLLSHVTCDMLLS